MKGFQRYEPWKKKKGKEKEIFFEATNHIMFKITDKSDNFGNGELRGEGGRREGREGKSWKRRYWRWSVGGEIYFREMLTGNGFSLIFDNRPHANQWHWVLIPSDNSLEPSFLPMSALLCSPSFQPFTLSPFHGFVTLLCTFNITLTLLLYWLRTTDITH